MLLDEKPSRPFALSVLVPSGSDRDKSASFLQHLQPAVTRAPPF